MVTNVSEERIASIFGDEDHFDPKMEAMRSSETLQPRRPRSITSEGTELSENPTGNVHLEDLVVNGRIILK
jgi:hypothetical protein